MPRVLPHRALSHRALPDEAVIVLARAPASHLSCIFPLKNACWKIGGV
jgi:hypothetical protein